MIHLNLLPPDQKRRLRHRVTLLRWRSAAWFALVIAVVANGLFVGVQFWLEEHEAQIQSTVSGLQSDIAASEIGELTQVTRTLNGMITPLSSTLVDGRDWSSVVAKILTDVPDNIRFVRVTIDATNVVTIEGVAATRTDFLAFDAWINENALLKNVQTESQASSREDLPFNYQATYSPTTGS